MTRKTKKADEITHRFFVLGLDKMSIIYKMPKSNMTNLDNAILALKEKRAGAKGRSPVYLGLPDALRTPCQKAIISTGTNTAYLLKSAIPAYLDDGIDPAVLQLWDKQEGVGNPIVTSIPFEMHERCSAISRREGVSLVAVLRAALGYMFGVIPVDAQTEQ